MSRMGDLAYRAQYERDTLTTHELATIAAMSAPRTTVAPPPDRTTDQARRDRALARAHGEANRGNVPMLVRTWLAPGSIREVWGLVSKRQDGPLYTVSLTHRADGVLTACDCEGAAYGRYCWHRAAVELAHADLIPCDVATRVRYRPKGGN
jgi:hypothetical protein